MHSTLVRVLDNIHSSNRSNNIREKYTSSYFLCILARGVVAMDTLCIVRSRVLVIGARTLEYAYSSRSNTLV